MEVKGLMKVVLVLLFLASVYFQGAVAPAPTVNGLPLWRYAGAAETVSRRVYKLDTTGDTSLTCIISSIASTPAPAGDEFYLNQNPGTNDYWLFTNDVSAFGATQYDVGFVCTDGNGLSNAEQTLNVGIVAGEDITIDEHTVTICAKTTGSGDVISTFTSVSTLGYDILYDTLTGGGAYFAIDTSTGVLTALTSLDTIDTSTSSLMVTATAYDTTNFVSVYDILTISFDSTTACQNTLPSTASVPTTSTQSEDITSTTTLFTLANDDPDTDTWTYEIDCVPAVACTLFELDASQNFKLKTGATVDFESQSTFDFTFRVWDGYGYSADYPMTLTLTDVNETPTLDSAFYYGTLTEETTPGSEQINAGPICSDQDAGDAVTFGLGASTHSGKFDIDPGTGQVNFSTVVDRETVGDTVNLLILCTDSGGISGTQLTVTSTLVVTITDVNDNTPTVTDAVFNINDATANGALLGTIAVADADSAANGNPTCTETSTHTLAGDFRVFGNCEVYFVSKSTDYGASQTITYDINAVDSGTPALTGSGVMSIIYTRTSTTTLTTTTEFDYWDHWENILTFVFALLFGLILFALLSACIIKYCCAGHGSCWQCCQEFRSRPRRERPRYRRRPETPETPPRRHKPRADYDLYDEPAPYYAQPQPKLIPVQNFGPSRVAYGPRPMLPGYIG